MPHGKTRILIVDDSQDILSSLSKILLVYGYKVDTATSGCDAIRKLDSARYDIVVCDVDMPGISGFEFVYKMRQGLHKDVDVILMSGFLDQDNYVQAIRLGAADYIAKPVDIQLLVDSISAVKEQRASRYETADLYKRLESLKLELTIEPAEFYKFTLSKLVSEFLLNNYKLSPVHMNEILTCVDEMAYNAFIHGTLQLSKQQRAYPTLQLEALIKEKLKDPKIRDMRIRFSMELSKKADTIKIHIEDDGDGFDYENWIEKIEAGTQFSLNEHGRGLALLYEYSDELVFSQGGRSTTIHKKINAHG